MFEFLECVLVASEMQIALYIIAALSFRDIFDSSNIGVTKARYTLPVYTHIYG